MTADPRLPKPTARRLSWAVRWTRLGLTAERFTRAFWPVWSLIFAGFASVFMGLHEVLPLEVLWTAGVGLVLGLIWTLSVGIRQFRWPTGAEARARVDDALPGQPLAALDDEQAIGADDAASQAVWRAHQARMADRVGKAAPIAPNLRIADRDPFGLRFVALIALLVAVTFGSVWRLGSVGEAVAVGPAGAAPAGPSWEGWVEPPLYTGQPSLYLADIPEGQLRIPVGSEITLRLYGEVGALTVTHDLTTAAGADGTQTQQTLIANANGTLNIEGPGGRSWSILVEPDRAPRVQLSAPEERTASGELKQLFLARDDYGVVAGTAQIALDLNAVDRRHGLAAEPEPRDPILLDLPMTISGDRTEFEETLVEDFAQHPWAGLPITLQMTIEDAIGQTGDSIMAEFALPERRFFDPLAASIAEQRRDILWTAQNGPRAAQILRAVSWKPEGFINNERGYLLLRLAIRRMENSIESDGLSGEERDEVADMLWEAALQFEEGDLGSARDRLQRARDRLSEAMRNGASDEEIAELMQELRDAMNDFMRELAEQQQRDSDGQQQAMDPNQMQQITGDQLQEMMDRIQELMEEGRMAEAQQLLDQLQQMMENMQVAEGQQGQGQQGQGQEAMEGLAETLREQQGLSDEAFRDLQEEFNPNAQTGESQQNQGRNGGQGQGQEHSQQGQGQQGQQPQGQQGGGGGQQQAQPGQQPGGNQQQDGQGGSLADRQQALRNELGRQQQNLPGAGTPEGDAARDALGRAGEAMDRAEEDLRAGNNAGALDNQADAMEALREGMRNLADSMAQQQEQQRGQGNQQGNAAGDPSGQRDPLGRQAGNRGRIGTDENLTGDEDVYRRARELLDEIRRRSGDQTRPDVELDYLRRLLDRF